MADINNVVDINTWKPLEQDNVGEMSRDVQDEIKVNKIRFNKVWILEATFNPLKRSEHFSNLIQDLHYTRLSDKTTDIAPVDIKLAA